MKDNNYPRYKMFREKYERGEFVPFKYYKKIKQDKIDEEFDKIFEKEKPIPLPRNKRKPVPLPRTIITKKEKALKDFTKSFEIDIKNSTDPLIQLQNKRKAVGQYLNKQLDEMKGFKLMETLKVTFHKVTGREEITIKSAYFNSVTLTIINKNELNNELQKSQQPIINKIGQGYQRDRDGLLMVLIIISLILQNINH